MDKQIRPNQLTLEKALAEAQKAKSEGDFSKLEKLCRAIIRYQPENTSALAMLDELKTTSQRKADLADPPKKELNPNSEEALFNLADTQKARGNYQSAVSNYIAVIALNPDNAEAFHNKGVAELHLNEPNQAIQSFDKALEINPEMGSAYGNRANAYLQLKELETALENFDRLIQFNPKLAAGYHSRGVVRGKLYEFDGAIKEKQ